MMRMISLSLVTFLRRVTDNQNPAVSGRRLKRTSERECSESSQSSVSGSPKTVAAFSKDTPCFFRLLRTFLASRENTFMYIR